MPGTDAVQAVEAVVRPRGPWSPQETARQPWPQPPFRSEPLGREGEASAEAAKLANAVDRLNQLARVFNTSLHFVVQAGHEIVVEVIDNETKEVIRRIPPGQVLEVDSKLQATLGLLLDAKA